MNDVIFAGALASALSHRIHRQRAQPGDQHPKSYRDTFALLLPFVSTGVRKPVDQLAVSDLTSA